MNFKVGNRIISKRENLPSFYGIVVKIKNNEIYCDWYEIHNNKKFISMELLFINYYDLYVLDKSYIFDNDMKDLLV